MNKKTFVVVRGRGPDSKDRLFVLYKKYKPQLSFGEPNDYMTELCYDGWVRKSGLKLKPGEYQEVEVRIVPRGANGILPYDYDEDNV